MGSVFLAYSSWLIISCFYAYQYVLRAMPSAIGPELILKFQLTSTEFSYFNSVYYIGYTAMQIPFGILIDKFGSKIVITISILLTVLGTLSITYSESWIIATAGRLMVGAASAAAVIGAFKVIRISFPHEKFAMLLGSMVTIGVVGGIYGGAPVNAMVRSIGLESTLLTLAAMGTALAVVAFLCLPGLKGRSGYQSRDGEEISLEESIWIDIKTILSNKKILLISLLGGLMIAPLEGFADAWSTIFFKVVYNFNEGDASLAPSLIFFGFGVGSPIVGYITGKTQRYYEILVTCGLVMSAAFIMLISKFGSSTGFSVFGVHITITYIFLIMIGFASGYQMTVIDKTSTLVPLRLVGITSATTNMIMMVFGSVFHVIIGAVISYYWDGTEIDGVQQYSAEALRNACITILIPLVISALSFGYLFMQERKRKISA